MPGCVTVRAVTDVIEFRRPAHRSRMNWGDLADPARRAVDRGGWRLFDSTEIPCDVPCVESGTRRHRPANTLETIRRDVQINYFASDREAAERPDDMMRDAHFKRTRSIQVASRHEQVTATAITDMAMRAVSTYTDGPDILSAPINATTPPVSTLFRHGAGSAVRQRHGTDHGNRAADHRREPEHAAIQGHQPVDRFHGGGSRPASPPCQPWRSRPSKARSWTTLRIRLYGRGDRRGRFPPITRAEVLLENVLHSAAPCGRWITCRLVRSNARRPSVSRHECPRFGVSRESHRGKSK